MSVLDAELFELISLEVIVRTPEQSDELTMTNWMRRR
jgi:hypothetical protein